MRAVCLTSGACSATADSSTSTLNLTRGAPGALYIAAAALLLSVISERNCSGTRCCPSRGIIAKQATALGSGARSDTGVDSVGELPVLAVVALVEVALTELALLLLLLLLGSAASLLLVDVFSQSMISLELGAHLCV